MVKVAYNLYATFFLPGVVPQGNMLTIGSASCQIFTIKKAALADGSQEGKFLHTTIMHCSGYSNLR